MDISEFLVSQQNDPASRALAANVFPGSRGAQEAGAIPEPPSPNAAPGGADAATTDPGAPGLDQGALDAGGGSAQDFTQNNGGDVDQFAEGGEVDGREWPDGPSEEIDDRRGKDEVLHPDATQFSDAQVGRNSLAADREFAGTQGAVPKYSEPVDAREAIKAGMEYGYTHHGANRAISDPTHESAVHDMMSGAGAIHPAQAHAAIRAAGGNTAKALSDVYNFYNGATPKKFAEGGPVMKLEEGGDPETPEGAIPEPPQGPETGEDVSGEMDAEPGFRKSIGDALGMRGRDAQLNAGKRGEPAEEGKPKRKGGIDVLRDEDEDPAWSVKAVGRGAAAAWGMLQHLRGTWVKASAIARAADDNGNPVKAAEGIKKALNDGLPDGENYEVEPTPDGKYSVNDTLGRFGVQLDKEGLHRIATTPFDAAVHMGTGHLLSLTAQQAEGVKTRMAQHDQALGVGTDGATPLPRASTPGGEENLPNEIKMVRGSYMSGGGRGSPVTMHGQSSQRVNARTGDIIPEETPQERVANINARSHQQVAETTAAGRVAAQGGANGLAKINVPAEVRLSIKQHWDSHNKPLKPNGQEDTAAVDATEKAIEQRVNERIENSRQQFGGPRTMPPGAPAGPTPAPGKGNMAPPTGGQGAPPLPPGATMAGPNRMQLKGQMYEVGTNSQGQRGWKPVNRLPTG